MYYLIEDLGECVSPQYKILHIIPNFEYALEKLNNLNEEKEKKWLEHKLVDSKSMGVHIDDLMVYNKKNRSVMLL